MIKAGGRRWVTHCVLALVVLYTLGVPAWLYAQDGAPLVTSATIRGQKRIELQAIEGRLTLKANDRFTADALREQVKILYATGYFEDVQVEADPGPGGVAVTFVVREKPFITEIVFDGNEELSDDKLKEKITIKSQTFLDQQQAKESAEKIRLAYQEDGFYNCQVIPVIQAVDEDRKRLTYFIKEGTKAKVKHINFEGMRAVTKEEMFKVTATREWIPWYGLITQLKVPSLLSDAGVLKREELGNDIERMREVYLNKGYLNVQISQPTLELSEDKKWFEISYAIVEGEPFIVQEVGFRGNTVFEDHELREGLNIKPGEIFQRAKIRGEITRITDLYGAKGYAFADVVPNVTPDNNARTATILLNVKEGEMMRIREIHVTGNDKTRDNVVRRELRLDEQDVIDTLALKRSFQRLNNLNFFETVEILPQQVETDKVDLNVKVKEKPTGQFSIGGGFSTLDKLVAIADITEGNLGGNGWLGRIRGQLGQQRSLGLVTFRNPYVNDSYNALQLDIYRTMTNYISYFESKSGASVTWSRWLSEYVNGSVSLFGEQLTYRDPQEGLCPDLIPLICGQLGSQSSTGIRTSIFRDTRDYYLDPRTGWRFSLGADYGTPALGGTNHFYKLYADVIKYTPLIYDTRFSIHVRYGQTEGIGGRPIPLTERFFVGGINTMRGFVFGRAGPVTPSGSLLGSAKELIFNNDFIFTISSEAKLNGVFFFDYGNGFDDNEPVQFNKLRSAVGFEARWISPFGPLRAGINLDPRPTERMGVFEFTIGSLF
ncbi:MAG: putative outer membrane protein assembly factor YaeT precursor [Nitrospira sp.]|nr:putative outer membrane protein assembly factor YaeT precursor [Nitrospira sp.]